MNKHVTKKQQARAERINVLDVWVAPSIRDSVAEVERIMDAHPRASQEEIYRLAMFDSVMQSAIIRIVTDAMIKIACKGKKGGSER
jgi:hypothetical protein